MEEWYNLLEASFRDNQDSATQILMVTIDNGNEEQSSSEDLLDRHYTHKKEELKE